MLIPIVVLAIVFLLIAIRQIGKIRLQIWHIMFLGAVAVILTAQISIPGALKAVNFHVMLFLFAMFIIGQALEQSGYLAYLSYHVFRTAQKADKLLLFILFFIGLGSALLVNDTLAIVGTPVVLMLAKKHKISAKPLLLALAFAITIGSVTSPIGNPQNFLIAVNGNVHNPFTNFIKYLFIPTIFNLFAAFYIIKLSYPSEFRTKKLDHTEGKIIDKELAKLSKFSIITLIALIAIKIILGFAFNFEFSITYIALLSAVPLMLSAKRFDMVRKVDWSTLVFFASMFVLMQSVWDTQFFQYVLDGFHLNLLSISVIFIIGILLSQFISNVPLVALYLPLLMTLGASTKELMALAAASTIAGNLTILGAASNVIIIQKAEKQKQTLTFWEFARIGIPLTVINAIVYYIFI